MNGQNNNDSFQFEDKTSNPSSNQATDSQELEQKCSQLENKVSQLEDQLKRSIADYQNLLRRSQQEREQARLYSAEPAVQALIPALDNFYYALKSLNEKSSTEQLIGSLRMVWNSLIASLESIGFKTIEGNGQLFDPNSQEAVTKIASSTQAEGTVLEVFRTGYSLNGKVLKPAQVAVAIQSSTN